MLTTIRPAVTTSTLIAKENPTTSAPSEPTTAAPDNTPSQLQGEYHVEVLTVLDHDAGSFTQGLEFHEGKLLESRGLRGESARSWSSASNGSVLVLVEVADAEVFAEGITLVHDRFFQLSWQAGQVLVGDRTTLQTQQSFEFDGEGWGLCFDGTRLIRSDGTDTLTFHDPEDFGKIGSVRVADANGQAVEYLNELECVAGQVLANVWGADYIVAIDPASGAVDAVIDASSIRPSGLPEDLNHSLNGTAYDAATNTYYLTGKLWPSTFNVRLVPAS